MLLLTLRGTIALYYGDEIGMRDVAIPETMIQDPRALNMADKNVGRDPARAPMQWDTTPNAGFSHSTPWLPVDRLFSSLNVQTLQDHPASLLSFYRRLIHLREKEPALHRGDFVPVYGDHQLISFVRQAENSARFLVVLNLVTAPATSGGQHNNSKARSKFARPPNCRGKTWRVPFRSKLIRACSSGWSRPSLIH